MKNVEVLYGYEGSATFDNPFKLCLAAASIYCWNYFNVPIHMYLDKEAYRSIPLDLRNSIDTLNIVDWKEYRDLFGNTKYFGFPKFVAMTKSSKAAIICDLDVICYDFSWFCLDKNAGTIYETPFVPEFEFNRLRSVREEYEGSVNNCNGGFYYLRTPALVRSTGRDLIHQCTVVEKESYQGDWWITLDEGIIRSCLEERGETFEVVDLNPFHIHVDKKTWGMESKDEWNRYFVNKLDEIQQKLPDEICQKLQPYVELCKTFEDVDKFKL